MNKLDMESKNIVDENMKYIKEKFPNVVVESEKGYAIDFNALKQELSDVIVDETKEKYQLTWPGKKEAIVTANTPTTKTLRPVREKSVNFDTTENIYIEGDNLEALKILQESYLGKIKCIYIDPPYNTGNDFIYNDKFNKEINQELLDSGQIDEEGNRLVVNNQNNGRFHSDWISMMYSRIKLARNLLSDNGIIFISIDDTELNNLRKICDEIFGDDNFVAICPRKTRGSATTKSDAELQKLNDYIVIYWKNKCLSSFNLRIIGEKEYPYEDNRGKYYIVPLQDNGPHGTRSARPNLYYPIYKTNDGRLLLNRESENDKEYLPSKHKNDDGRWMWSKEKFSKEWKDLCIKDGKVYIKHYYNKDEDQNRYRREKNWLDEYLNTKGTISLNETMNIKGIFDNPKPVELIKLLIEMSTKENDIILDFFSGSSTTAHAIMNLNSEDNGKRKYIMVQLPEDCMETTEANKHDFKTICDIGEERIRRAAKKIKEETNANIDYGFRVYKIDSSNMKDVYYKPSELNQEQLELFETNIKDDRTSEDLLTQVILDLGLTLDLKMEEKNILGNKVYFVDNNSLVACFDDDLNINIIDEICKHKPLKVVFKDNSFENDNDKINVEEKIKKLSPETELNIL